MIGANLLLEIKSSDELQKVKPLPPVIVGDNLPSVTLLQLCETEGVRHVVQRSNLSPNVETKLAVLMIQNPRDYFDFPVSSILGVKTPTRETEDSLAEIKVQIDTPAQKKQIVDLIEAYASRFRNPRSLIYDIAVVADELISNALYNAPYVDEANTRSGPERQESSISVDPSKKPEVFAGSDGTRLVLGVRDSYGKLNTEMLVRRIRKCHENGLREQISYEEGGAGIGSFMVFDSCVGMYVAVDKGKSTSVFCSFPIGMTAGKRKAVPKNIHILSVY
jgi:hypothetical protein